MEENAPTSPTTPVSPPPPADTPTTPDPVARFRGLGTNFRAKLIGIDDVPESRGDQMCQESIIKLKAAVLAAGRHKQKVIVNVSLEGIKIVDVMTGEVQHVHPVHRISFIARDTTDRRAFGYVYGADEGRHQFYGIKTAKAAENLVLALRDLFQVVYDMKKKEMEEVKASQDDGYVERPQQVESYQPSVTQQPIQAPPAQNNDNIMDLKQQLTNIQEGINNMDAIGPWSNEANGFQDTGGSEQNADLFGMNLSDISSLSSDLSCSSNFLIDGFAGGRRFERESSKRSTSSQPISTSNSTSLHNTSKTDAIDGTSLKNSFDANDNLQISSSNSQENIQGEAIYASINDVHEASFSVPTPFNEPNTTQGEYSSLEETDFKMSEVTSESEASCHDDVNTLKGSNSELSDITDIRSKTPANQDFVDPFCMSDLPEGAVCEGFGDDPFVSSETDNFTSNTGKIIWPSEEHGDGNNMDNFESPSGHEFESDPFADRLVSKEFGSGGFDVDPFVARDLSTPAATSPELEFTVDPFAIPFPSNSDPFQSNEADDPFSNVEDIFGEPIVNDCLAHTAPDLDNEILATNDDNRINDTEEKLDESSMNNDSSQNTSSIENENKNTNLAKENTSFENLSIVPPVIPPRRDIRFPVANISDSDDDEDEPPMPEYLPPMPEKPPPVPKRRPPPPQTESSPPPPPKQNSSYSDDLFSLGIQAAQPAPQPGAKMTNDQILSGFGGVSQQQPPQQMFAMQQQGMPQRMPYQPATNPVMPGYPAASYPQMGAMGGFPSGPSPAIPPRPGAMRPPTPQTLPQGSNQNPFGDSFAGQAPMLTPATSNTNAASNSQEPAPPADPFAGLIPGMGASNSASVNKKDMFKNYQMSKPQPPPRTNPPLKAAEAANAEQSSFDSYFLQSVGGVPVSNDTNAATNQFGVQTNNPSQPFDFTQNGMNGGTSLFG